MAEREIRDITDVCDPATFQPFAEVAFMAAYVGDENGVAAALKRLEAVGDHAVFGAACMWVDTMITETNPEWDQSRGAFLQGFIKMNEDGTLGEPTFDPDEVPPPVAWAAQVMEKRVLMDHAALAQVWESVTSEVEFGTGLVALATMCAQSVREHRTGAVVVARPDAGGQG